MPIDKSRYYRRRSNFGWKDSKCARCMHDEAGHFWWDRAFGTGESVIGCKVCRDEICQDRGVSQNMSAVNLCERCGALMLGKAVGFITFSASREERDETQELCPGCFGAFMDFMHSVSEPSQRTPYREPWKESAGTPESMLMLERGYCGEKHPVLPGMCLRAKGHDGNHRDGSLEWSA